MIIKPCTVNITVIAPEFGTLIMLRHDFKSANVNHFEQNEANAFICVKKSNFYQY